MRRTDHGEPNPPHPRAYLAALALAAALAGLAACGGGGGGGSGGGGGGGGGGPVTLMADDFSGTFAASWQDLSTQGGVASSRAAEPLGSLPHGNPSPGLLLHGETNGATGSARTHLTFSTAELTIAFDARRVAGRQDQEMWVIVRSLSTSIIRAYLQMYESSIRYALQPAGQLNSVSRTHTSDGAFHRFTLTIDASGEASWYRDGFLQHRLSGMPIEDVFLEVTGPSGTTEGPGTGHFDNLLITAP